MYHQRAPKNKVRLVDPEKVLLLGSNEADARLLRRTLVGNIFSWVALDASKEEL